MKYLDQINSSFARLGYSPRPGQIEAVNRVLTAFVDEAKQNVVLDAPTGSGKSIIAVVVAETLTEIKGGDDNSIKSSISNTATNVLAKQYANTFGGLQEQGKYITVKGAANYPCPPLSSTIPETAESCAYYTMQKAGGIYDSLIQEHCYGCEYLKIKKRRNLVRHLSTNYSYYFVDRMYTGNFEKRDLIVWDEAHLINDLFSDHNAIQFSQKFAKKLLDEYTENLKIIPPHISKVIKDLTKAVDGGINDDNYRDHLNSIAEVYQYAIAAKDQLERLSNANKMSEYTKLSKFVRKYESLHAKIDDFFKYEYEHVFEYKEEDAAISVKPIFVSTMFNTLQGADHNLFMSATVSAEYMIKTLSLDPAQTAFIKLPPMFPKENKELIFFDPMSLSYKSLQVPETVKRLAKNVVKIVDHHVKQDERGIILTPSFKLQEDIVKAMMASKSFSKYKLFEQRKGEKLENVLSAFKAYTGLAILVSPSMYEGVDLPGDLSRFQILVKAPYPSLGDKRIKFILDHHPEIFN